MPSKTIINKPNWKVIILSTLAILSFGITVTFPFSYTPAMIKHFGYSDMQRGYYNGILVAARFFGSIFGCFVFPALSDRYGRRPTMLCTLFGQALMNLLFGFSYNFTMAVIVRLITGMSGGIVPIVTTIILEISDETNQSTGLSCTNVAFALGAIVGSFAGGPLVEPLVQYPGVFPENEMLQQFPFCLPSIVFSVLCFSVFFVNLIFLPETNGLRQEIADEKVGNTQKELKFEENNARDNTQVIKIKEKEKLVSSISMQHLPLRDFQYFENERDKSKSTSALFSIHTRKNRCERDHFVFDSKKQTVSELVLDNNFNPLSCEKNSNLPPKNVFQKLFSFFDIIPYCFKNYSLRLSILVYGCFGFAYVIAEEATTLFMYDKPLDGLGFIPKHIAVIGGIFSFAKLPLTIIFPKLERKFGFLRVQLFFMIPCLLSILLIPYTRFLHNNTTSQWIILILVGVPFRLVVLCVVTCQNMAVNNSAGISRAGSVNGIATMFSNMCRGLGILIGSAVYQLSVSHDFPYPVDVNITFQISGITLILGAIMVYYLPCDLEKQRRIKITK